ncbi:MAG TPA: penicillin-binding protein 1C [Burkholderiales bacterium]|nr:penicillin-binding protein 1C [Burkholderiales bacterium]
MTTLSPRRSLLARTLLLATLVVPVAHALPHYEDVRAHHLSTEAQLIDRNGAVIHEMRVDMSGRRLDWVALDDVSPAFLRAVIRAEDKRFYEHGGVDWLALTDAMLDNLFAARPRGASTLSMQVAAMLEQNLRARRQHRTVGQKWDQIRAARELEHAWSKRQILEAYLNLSTFRGEVQGIGAAARVLFGKAPSGIDEREALILAVLLRGPNAKPELVAKRACALAQSMTPAVSCEGLPALAEAQLSKTPHIAPTAALAPHIARALLNAKNRRVVTTLDGRIQALALEAAQRQLANLQSRNVRDAAALVIDNRSGDVLAYVGNAGPESSARFVDGVRALRQAGSTLKPFLYELAIEQRTLTAASLLDDSSLNIVTPAGLYVPQNYDREFRGLVSVRSALAASLNVPAVRTLTLLGPDAFVERLRALGFESLRNDGDYYGFSLALGSAEVTLWDLANAYRTLAQGGYKSALRLLPGAPSKGNKVLDPTAAYIISDILSDRLARSTTFGLDNALTPRVWAAVKTGTSKDMRDNWCVGFTARYTVAAWVGNFDGSPMWDVSGVTGAAPLWLEIVDALHRATPSIQPPPPRMLERTGVTFEDGIEADRQEWFLPHTALTTVVAKGAAAEPAHILYPADGQIIAIDPDIPFDVQRVRFRADTAGAGLHWRLNERAVEGSFWRPESGHWRLTLHDATDRLLDEVRFEVRGNAVNVHQAAAVESTSPTEPKRQP